MPTYEYHCDACDHNFDEFQGINDPPLKKCPQCRKAKLRRVFGAGAAIIFKGSGFYQTDYRSESYQSAAKADQEKAGGTAKTEGTGGGDKSGTADKAGGGSGAKGAAKAGKSSKSGG